MTEGGEADDVTPPEPFDLDDEEGSAPYEATWSGACGQMIAALLVVTAMGARPNRNACAVDAPRSWRRGRGRGQSAEA